MITWGRDRPRAHQYDAHWTYHPTRQAALAAAPPNAPWTVIDIRVKPRPYPPITEFLRTRVVAGGDPHPAHRPKRADARPSTINPL